MLNTLVMAAEESPNLTPVLGLVGVALTAAVTFLTTWRWPTLRRRVQDHIALMKDLPADSGEPLRQLLEDEVEVLARMERRRLDLPSRVLSSVARASVTVTYAVYGGLLMARVLGLPVERISDHWFGVITNILTLAFILAVVALTWLTARRMDLWARFRDRFLPSS